MTTYLALLRGINVGGNTLIKMTDLKEALETANFENVRTYIQSGNVIFDSKENNKQKLGIQISECIYSNFKYSVDVIVFSDQEWKDIIVAAPKWWGKDSSWKHNLLVMTRQSDTKQLLTQIGILKPEIEKVLPGMGVLYQSVSFEKFGRTTSGKLASNPIYKQMTIRNFNTATKIAALLES